MMIQRLTDLLVKCKFFFNDFETTSDTKCKMNRFIQSPLSAMKQEYVDSVSKADEDIKQLEKTQKYWERQAADAQGNLKDILQGPRTM